jgi:hypothetical protein
VIMAVAGRFNTRTLLATAVITVVAFLFRHDHGLFIGIASLTAVIVSSRDEGWRTVVQRSAAFAGLVLLMLLPWLLFVQAHQGLVDYVSSGVSVSQAEAVGDSLRELPRLRLGELNSTRNALTWLFYTFHALPFGCILVLVRRRSQPDAWPGETAVVAALATMAILVNVTFLRGNLDGRVPDAIVPAALLGSWLLGQVWRRVTARVPLFVAAGFVVATTAWAVVRVGDVLDNLAKTELLRGPAIVQLRAADLWDRFHRRVPERDHVPSRYALALLPFIDYVGRCTADQDRLFVTGLLPELNVLADRGFAGGHMSYRPFFYTSDVDQAQTVSRLQKQSVAFVVSLRQWYPELKRQMSTVFAYVEQRFEPLAHVAVPETEGIDVLVDRSHASRGVDPATGWPCFR